METCCSLAMAGAGGEPMLSADAPVLLLQHSGLDDLSGKTGLAFLRYRQGPVVAVLDPGHVGADLPLLTGIPRSVPVVGSVAEAMVYGPKVAVVGLAPSGGLLPPPLRQSVLEALRSGLSIASGLHTRLGDDPELAAQRHSQASFGICAVSPRAWRPQHRRRSCPAAASWLWADMSVGKMSAALELTAAARGRGLDARRYRSGRTDCRLRWPPRRRSGRLRRWSRRAGRAGHR